MGMIYEVGETWYFGVKVEAGVRCPRCELKEWT